MPRDSDKNNDSRGRRDRPRRRQGPLRQRARGPEKKFAKRGFAGKGDGDKRDGERRPYAGKSDGAKSFGKKPYSGGGKPYAGKRDGDDRPPRRDFGDAPRPRGDRPFRRPSVTRRRSVRSVRSSRAKIAAVARSARTRRAAIVRISIATTVRRAGDRDDARPAGRSSDRKFGDKKPYTPREGGGEKRPYTPRGEGFRKDGDRPRGDRPFSARPSRDGDRPRGDRPERKFGGDKKFSRGAPDRGPRKDFGDRPIAAIQSRGRSARIAASAIPVPPATARAISTSRALTARATTAAARSVRAFRVRARIARRRSRRNSTVRARDRRSRAPAPKAAPTGRSIRAAKRVTIGRAARTRTTARFLQNARRSAAAAPIASAQPEFDKRAPQPPRVKKSGERIAKVVSRAGLASRRDAEEWITQGRVTVNGRVINSPALDVTANDVIAVDGKPLPPRERTRLFMYHKPRGLMTTHADPEGRPTVFDNLPEGLPRLISIGRLDFNTEGLLLLTNDGGLARALELPDTGWLRRYRVRAHGEVTQAQLDELKKGVEVDGVKYGSIDATLERDQGANVWLVFAIREGKNREVRNVMAHLGLEVNRLIRVSYGPFQLGELAEGQVEEVKTRVLREQLGEKIATLAGADFNRPMPGEKSDDEAS